MEQVRNRLVATHRHGGLLVLLFDYDGTLTPIVEHPSLAVLPADTRSVLARLAKRPNVEVGVISGRTIEDLKGMVALPGLCFAGTGGLELDLHGTKVEHPLAARTVPLCNDLGPRLEERLVDYPGAWLEHKRFGWTVHYRNLSPFRFEELHASVAEITRPYRDLLRFVPGPMAIEIAIELGWHKGTAVRLILEHLGSQSATILYAGDNANDADAFDAVASLGGICLGIGADAPATSEYRLSDPAALRVCLEELDGSLGEKTISAGN